MSLLCRLKKLVHKGELEEKDLDRIVIIPKEQEPCEDCISRQAVLDGIEELKKSPWATDKRGIGFEYLITEALEVVEDLCVKQLPPITPKPKTDVLDKIRAEIEQEPYISKMEVLDIIDKYKAESEDKE